MTNQIEFKIASPKYKVLYEPHRYKIFLSGRGTGKSWALAQAAVYYMYTTNVRILSCRMFLNSIAESNYKLIEQTIERMGLTQYFELTKTEIRCIKTGSLMFFKGLNNNYISLKSLEGIGICLVDEAESITEEAWNILLPTIRAVNSEIWISFNPRLVTDATWQRFVVNTPSNAVVVRLSLEDNPYVSKDLLDAMEHDKATDPVKYKWIWEGEPMGAEECTFITPNIISDARNRIAMRNENLKVIAGLDVSGMGKDWTVLVRRRGAEILSVDRMQRGNTSHVTEWVKSIYVDKGWDKIVVDATGSSGVADNIQIWGDANRTFETIKWNAARQSRQPTRYLNSRTESWDIMRSWLIDQGQLTRDKEWDELSTVSYVLNSKEQLQLQSKATLKKSPDNGDALALSLWIPDEEKPIKVTEPPMFNAPVFGAYNYGATIT